MRTIRITRTDGYPDIVRESATEEAAIAVAWYKYSPTSPYVYPPPPVFTILDETVDNIPAIGEWDDHGFWLWGGVFFHTPRSLRALRAVSGTNGGLDIRYTLPWEQIA